jgi:hypothetical protein
MVSLTQANFTTPQPTPEVRGTLQSEPDTTATTACRSEKADRGNVGVKFYDVKPILRQLRACWASTGTPSPRLES